MPKLRRVSGQETIRTLERLGFVQVRQRGSHVVLKKQMPEGDVGCAVPALASRTGSRHVARHFATGQGHARRVYGEPVMPNLALSLLPDTFAICRLSLDASVPDWALTGGFFSVTRTADEPSIVCPQSNVPPEIQCDRDWRCLKVEGPLDLSLIGILASLTAPLARTGIGIFAVSTYDTDYVLVKEKRLEETVLALSREGHRVRR